MSDQGRQELEAGLVAGRLEGISVPDLLWGISRCGKTGVLSVTHDDTTKRVYIHNGKIVFATSSDPDDRLGETLLREDLITLDQLQRATSRYRAGKRLGTILVEIAAITPQDLVNGVVSQIKDIALTLFPLEDGVYRFEEGALPTEEVITVGMNTEELLLQGIRQVRSFSRVRRSVGPPRTRYRLSVRWEEIATGLSLSEGERTLLRHLDATGRTVDDLCGEVFLSNFEIYQALWAFKVLGAIEETDRAPSAPESAAIEGSITSDGIAPILVRLGREGQTGILYLSDSAVDRAIHFREGRCVFATSSNIDDGLVAHLLRRGVISLRDREETARRLLSNKRVGTILREMGVIDETDLRDMVRDQLREIVLDTFQWERGEFAFVPGALPTAEEITLEMSIEDIVRAGIGRVTSWSRVRKGSGDREARVVLVGDYLQILDRMSVGQEEWEVVAALRSPRTVADVCREVALGDFRICQLLWTFRVLGIAEEGALEDRRVQERGAAVDAAGVEPLAAPPESVVPPVPVVAVAGAAEDVRAVVAAGPDDDGAAGHDEPLPEREEPPRAEASPESPEAEVIEEIAALGTEPELATGTIAPVDALPDPGAAEDPTAGASEPESPATFQFEIDSPHDATQYIPREIVEASLQAQDEDAPIFEIADPGELSSDARPEDDAVGESPACAPCVDAVPDHPGEPDASRALSVTDVETLDGASAETDDPGATDLEATPEDERQAFVPDDAGAHEVPSEAGREPALAAAGTQVVSTEGNGGNGADGWHPPSDLEDSIARFNAMQRVIYRSIRSEVGAGATNFVRACGGSLGDRFGEVFATVELQSDGAWDAGKLRQLLVEYRVERPWDGLKRLLDQEIDKLRIHIGEARANSLQERLESLEV